jgi:hypothetical protein
MVSYRPISKIDTTLKRVRVNGKNKKKTIEEFPVSIVNNEEGTDTLLLVPVDKIRVTPRRNKENKETELQVENADFYIKCAKVTLEVLGVYRGYLYVCKFQKYTLQR